MSSQIRFPNANRSKPGRPPAFRVRYDGINGPEHGLMTNKKYLFFTYLHSRAICATIRVATRARSLTVRGLLCQHGQDESSRPAMVSFKREEPMKTWRNKQRIVGVALALALLGSLVLGAPAVVAMGSVELLDNGSFEGGFRNVPGCGMVGNGWGCFTNGGTVDYGFYDDQWAPVVKDGKNSQLIELNTRSTRRRSPIATPASTRPANLVAGATYTFKLSGVNPRAQPRSQRGQVSLPGSSGATPPMARPTGPRWQTGSNCRGTRSTNRTSPTGLQDYATTFRRPAARSRSSFACGRSGARPQGIRRQPGRHQPDGKGAIIQPPVGSHRGRTAGCVSYRHRRGGGS